MIQEPANANHAVPVAELRTLYAHVGYSFNIYIFLKKTYCF